MAREGERPAGRRLGHVAGGESFRGPIELAGVLENGRTSFAATWLGRCWAYALGRGLEYYDACAVDHIVEATHQGGDRFSVLVNEIVRSEPFLKRRGSGARHGS